VATLRGETGYDMFGATLARGGDLDRDGRAELLVGIPLADSPNFNSGAVQVLSDKPRDRDVVSSELPRPTD